MLGREQAIASTVTGGGLGSFYFTALHLIAAFGIMMSYLCILMG